MRTMAMQRASPTMISPVRSSGRSARNTQARVNISAGPMTQLRSEGQAEGAAVGELVAEVAVADLGQHRVHHGQQPDGDRQRDGVDLDALEGGVQVRDQPAQHQAGGHGEPDPHRQEPVERRELGGHRAAVGRGHRAVPDRAGASRSVSWASTSGASV